MTNNVFYRKNQDHIFGDFVVSGSMVQIHVLYNYPKTGVTTVEFYKLQPDGSSRLYRNKNNSLQVKDAGNEALQTAINTYFKNQVIVNFQIKDNFDD